MYCSNAKQIDVNPLVIETNWRVKVVYLSTG